MTQHPTEPPASGAAGGGSTAVRPAAPAGRIGGVDAARALAVFGMIAVHLGAGALGFAQLADGGTAALATAPPSDGGDGGWTGTLHALARGRSSALFAFLAGVSLALMSGGTQPRRGTALRRTVARILVRALALAVLGAFLDLLGAPIAIILTYYGGFFLLALPLLGLRAGPLAGAAAAIAVVGPQASFLLRSAIGDDGLRENSIGGITDLLLTGYYPAFTFMAFVVAGMAVGRLDLRAPRVRAWLAGTGAAAAAAGYGGSWLLLHPLGALDRLALSTTPFPGGASGSAALPAELLASVRAGVEQEMGDLHGQVPTDSPLWLLAASPHSGTSFEAVGAVGTSLLALAACLVLADRLAVPMYPLCAAGSMALSVYVGHILVIAAEGMSATDFAPFRWELFVLSALVLCTLWKLLLGRGPLERALGAMADSGASLVPDEPAAARRG
ncbi:heparan-alpha-glucosaminide N-acetyltransferase domain-containing protein [Nocardiopsis coralliicola]